MRSSSATQIWPRTGRIGGIVTLPSSLETRVTKLVLSDIRPQHIGRRDRYLEFRRIDSADMHHRAHLAIADLKDRFRPCVSRP